MNSKLLPLPKYTTYPFYTTLTTSNNGVFTDEHCGMVEKATQAPRDIYALRGIRI